MVASLEHQQALVSNKKTDTSNYRAFPGERLTGEWPPGTRPYVSDQMLWFRSSGFYNLDPLAVADASPRARDKTGAVRGDDAHVRPWTTANSRPAPPSTPKDVRGPAAFADMEKPPHQMEGYWRRAAELSARLERGPKHEGWGTGLLPHRPKNFASELRGKTSRPISNAEKLNWSPRASTPRHQPLAKPQDRDPMWGVSKSLVADESRTSGFSAVNSFMTTNEQFHGHAGWHPDAKPAGMVMPPPPPEMRGRYHVDPRGVCSPWVAYEARLGEGAMGRAARAPPPYSVGF